MIPFQLLIASENLNHILRKNCPMKRKLSRFGFGTTSIIYNCLNSKSYLQRQFFGILKMGLKNYVSYFILFIPSELGGYQNIVVSIV